jgi:uncharacterized protein (DUF849 family)
VLNNSTGGGINGDMIHQLNNGLWEINFEERLKGMEAPGAEMCTLDAQTICASIGDKEILVPTTPRRTRQLAKMMQQRGIKPEWEVFSLEDMVQDVNRMIEERLDDPPYFVNIVLGVNAFQGALPYTPKILQLMVDHLPKGAIFNVSAIGSAQLPATTQALLLGGHVRVGLEDNLYYAKGDLATNVRLLERMVRIARELGFEPATSTEARNIMGLKPLHQDSRPRALIA